MESSVYYDTEFFSDEKGCLAAVYHGDMRYRIYYYPMSGEYRVVVDGSVYDASNRGGEL